MLITLFKDKVFVCISFCYLTAIFLLFWKMIPLGLPDHWVISYRSQNFISFRNLSIGVIVAILLIFLPKLVEINRPGTALLILFLATLLMNLCLHRPGYYSWLMRVCYTANANGNPFFGRAKSIESIFNYPREHLEFSRRGYAAADSPKRRLTTYPPGLPMLYIGLINLGSANPKVKSWLMNLALTETDDLVSRRTVGLPDDDRWVAGACLASIFHLIIMALIPVTIYLLFSLLTSSTSAIKMALLSALTPAFHLYAAFPNILFPLISCLIVYFAILALRNNSGILAGVSALLLTSAVFHTLAVLPLIVFIIFIVLFLYQDLALNKRIYILAVYLATGVSFVLILLCFDYNFVTQIFTALENNREFYRAAGREYLLSMPYNAIIFTCFASIPCILYLLVIPGMRNRLILSKKGWFSLTGNERFGFLFLAMMVLVLVSGGARGEVERSWMVFMPFVYSGAAQFVNERSKFYLVYLLSITYCVITILMIEVTFNFP